MSGGLYASSVGDRVFLFLMLLVAGIVVLGPIAVAALILRWLGVFHAIGHAISWVFA